MVWANLACSIATANICARKARCSGCTCSIWASSSAAVQGRFRRTSSPNAASAFRANRSWRLHDVRSARETYLPLCGEVGERSGPGGAWCKPNRCPPPDPSSRNALGGIDLPTMAEVKMEFALSADQKIFQESLDRTLARVCPLERVRKAADTKEIALDVCDAL